MKKLMLVLVVCLITAGEVFAEISVGGGMEAAAMVQVIDYVDRDDPEWTPIGDPIVVSGFGGNNDNRSKLSLTFTADLKDTVGLYAEIALYPWWYDNRQQDILNFIDSIELDMFYGWYRPFEWFKIDVGRFNIDTLRGKVEGFNWGDYLGVGDGGTDSIFTRFEGRDAIALEFPGPFGDLVPALKNLYLGAMMYNIIEANSANNRGIYGGYTEAKYMLENIQAAVGYDIPNIGSARFQYIGVHPAPNTRKIADSDNNDSNNGPRFQAAFAYTGLPGLTAELGGTLSLLVMDPTVLVPALNDSGEIVYYEPRITVGNYLEPHRVSLGIQYDFGFDLSLRGGGEFSFGGYSEPTGSGRTDMAPVTKIYFSPSYKFNDRFSVAGDGGIEIYGDENYYDRLNKKGGVKYGFGAYAQWNFVNADCYIRAGISYAGGEGLGVDRSGPSKLDTLITIPVYFHLGF
ncbi:MAG: hypothetical protein LBK02_03830 [Treponema sp.]|jgi:hypothetical protein|nr:hypothetical protein [Treponema sp.]